ncbi:MAG TPA: glycosyltransferase family 2 protein [Gemmatimonadales bacterium]|jgi:glycosyltransferase involved in cell wall biosynthesis|nr:glycosyltransferase family 2 protein [Gemmatimonadales bacterium]
MLYLCLPTYNEAPTIGLLLWKIRQTFQTFPREYELLVVDDASTDDTAERLEPYTRALPLTIVRHGERHGYTRSLEALLRLALERTDRPRRDAAIVMHADFAHGPEFLPEIVKRIESGADLVVTEATLKGQPSRAYRWVRRGARWLLRGLRVPGVRDLASGFAAVRLSCLRNAIRAQEGPLLTAEGWAANAELVARAAAYARRVDTVSTVERHDLKSRPSRVDPWAMARLLWREGGRVRVRGMRQPDPRRGQPGTAPEEPDLEEATR